MLPGRLALAPPSSFELLAKLLLGVEPQGFAVGSAPLAMTVGEPQDAPPAFIGEIVHAHARDFGRYPPIAGTAAFRAAVAGWLARRFDLPASAIHPDEQIIPLNGSREGLFFALPPLVPESKNGGRPIVLVPNPFYVTYPTAVLAAGAEPYYVPARAETGFLPDFAAVPKAILERTIAAFSCSPSNPQGACATAADWRKLFELADRHDFTVLADECYCEIYDSVAPTGALSVRYAMTGGLERLIAFHSLSKRSSAPGLRSGFAVGASDLIASLTRFRNTSAPQVPLPVLEASIAAWGDEVHVGEMRARYRERFAIARRLLGNHRGFHMPGGAFYVWLDVGDGAGFARALWRRTGVRVMPGAFMGVEEIPGKPASNPGFPYVRIALVHDSLTIQAALEGLAEFLEAARPA